MYEYQFFCNRSNDNDKIKRKKMNNKKKNYTSKEKKKRVKPQKKNYKKRIIQKGERERSVGE